MSEATIWEIMNPEDLEYGVIHYRWQIDREHFTHCVNSLLAFKEKNHGSFM